MQTAAAAASASVSTTTSTTVATSGVQTATGQQTANADAGETIHTTANHPWLTADRGWVEAGQLRAGESIVTLSGAAGTVVWVHPVAGQGDMYNLTVANDHTYAVGDGQWVVHNVCGQVKFDADRYAKSIANSSGITGAAKRQATVAVMGVENGEGTRFLASLNNSAWEAWGDRFANGLAEFKAAHPDVDIELVPQQAGAAASHAEDNLRAFQSRNGLTFQGIGASNNVCIVCAPGIIRDYGWGSIGTPYDLPRGFPGADDPGNY